nr:GntR family transcriptional regulator [Corallococcus coralloides]
MGMERRGLVAYVEAQLERDIALGRLPPCGQFGSEAKLARRYDVCRGTIREAMRRLAARGLVVQRPGRKTRAVALDESLTLENLGLALHDKRNPDARSLLEGYFSLKRQVLVELLADCCARASDVEMYRLRDTCFKLQDAARWESGERCAQVEFELLQLAARVAARPWHVLLVQSLQRAFQGCADRLMPLMGGEALRQWASWVMTPLEERDARTLQHELPALMKACDELVLNAFAPVPTKPASPEDPCAQEGLVGAPVAATGKEDAPEVRPSGEEQSPGCIAQASEDTEALGVAPCPQAQACSVDPASEALLSSTAPGPTPPEMGGAHAERPVMDSALGSLSGGRTEGDGSSQESGLPRLDAPATGPRGPPCARIASAQDGAARLGDPDQPP